MFIPSIDVGKITLEGPIESKTMRELTSNDHLNWSICRCLFYQCKWKPQRLTSIHFSIITKPSKMSLIYFLKQVFELIK